MVKKIDKLLTKAICLVAENDEPTLTEIEDIASLFSCQLIADLFEQDVLFIAECIRAYRTGDDSEKEEI